MNTSDLLKILQPLGLKMENANLFHCICCYKDNLFSLIERPDLIKSLKYRGFLSQLKKNLSSII